MTSTEKVIQKAIELVDSSPPGKRYSELIREISTTFPNIPVNTIHGSIHKFRTELPATIYQPSRGLYRAVKYRVQGERQEADRLFSHKSYIVVPDNSSEDDIARLDALSRIFGIGLVIFNSLDPKNPDFRIRSRAAREEPDMFYVNKYLKLVEDELFA